MTQSTKLDCIMRAICYNPDGRRLAVGMGGNIGKGKQRRAGAFVVLDADTLEVLHEGKDSKHWITDIKCVFFGVQILPRRRSPYPVLLLLLLFLAPF